MLDQDRSSAVITHTMLSVLFLALLIVSTFWVLSPFLTSILWATIITVATWPFLLRLQVSLGGRRRPAVAIMTAAILLVVFVPLTLAIATIAGSAPEITAAHKAEQEKSGVRMVSLSPAATKAFLDSAYAAGWAEVVAADPVNGPKLKELFYQ